MAVSAVAITVYHEEPFSTQGDRITDIAFVMRAATFAADRHRNQRRKGASGRPYIGHPLEVAQILADHGVTDERVLAAALLHDVVEDTPTSFAEIEREFGARVRSLVAEVTDDKSLPSDEAKRLQEENARYLSHDARLVRIADKLVNVRDIAADPPPSWTLERKRKYVAWTRRVVNEIRGTNESLERLFDEVFARAAAAVELPAE